MKSILVLLAIVFSGTVSGQKKLQHENPAPGSTIKPATSIDTLQYAIGAFMALWLNQKGLVIQSPDAFSMGMNDILQNKPRLIPDSTVIPKVLELIKLTQKNRAMAVEQQLFESIKDRPGMSVLPSGVRYQVLRTGKGAYPTDKDTLVLNMIAKLSDGSIVEDTYQKKSPFIVTFPALFKGLADPLALMAEGSQWQLYVPSALAYGEKETALVPPFSSLVITVELVEIRHPKLPQ